MKRTIHLIYSSNYQISSRTQQKKKPLVNRCPPAGVTAVLIHRHFIYNVETNSIINTFFILSLGNTKIIYVV